ncbi:MAG: hypothetical protein IIW01_07330, partial [Thermoguttaceae bacterium]|nr:hypothetical protein [Thermoguttaceae bacterium]
MAQTRRPAHLRRPPRLAHLRRLPEYPAQSAPVDNADNKRSNRDATPEKSLTGGTEYKKKTPSPLVSIPRQPFVIFHPKRPNSAFFN